MIKKTINEKAMRNEKAMSEAQKRAKKKYQKNITRLTIDFYPTEKELVEQIKNQPKKQTYIKDLIRQDIQAQIFK